MSIKKPIYAFALCVPLALAGCMTPQQERQTVGAVLGGTAGLVTAKALGFGDGWVLVTALAGAAAGTLIARNSATNECAYADGRGGYTRGRCR